MGIYLWTVVGTLTSKIKSMTKNTGYDFNDYQSDTLTRPRDKAWSNWAKLEKKGDKVQGFIRDAFYREAEGQFPAQRGVTLEQPDGVFINIGIKRLDFILAKTNDLRIGDPLTVVLDELQPASTKGFSPTKIYGFYGKNMPENEGNPTVEELDSPEDTLEKEEETVPSDDETPGF